MRIINNRLNQKQISLIMRLN